MRSKEKNHAGLSLTRCRHPTSSSGDYSAWGFLSAGSHPGIPEWAEAGQEVATFRTISKGRVRTGGVFTFFSEIKRITTVSIHTDHNSRASYSDTAFLPATNSHLQNAIAV